MTSNTSYTVAYLLLAIWPGVTTADGHPDCHLCSWAWHEEHMEVKYLNRACPKHSRLMSGGGVRRRVLEEAA